MSEHIKWEYKVIRICHDENANTLGKTHDCISLILNIHGEKGWEVCGCSLQEYVLKRPLKE